MKVFVLAADPETACSPKTRHSRRWSLNHVIRLENFQNVLATQLKDQHMHRTHLIAVAAAASVLLLSSIRTIAQSNINITNDFSIDPAARGWQAFGSTNLFHWDLTNQNLRVTWDSAQPNSYFHLPIGAVLTTNDDFAFSFDLLLADIAVGVNPDKPYSFQVAVGFLNWQDATNNNLQRGSGIDAVHGPRNLAEFDYFPDSGFGATVSPTMVSSSNEFASGFDFPLEIDPGHLFHIALSYTAATRKLATTMTRDGQPFGPIQDVIAGASFAGFRLDQFSISSYSDAGADGSLLAHGVIDNVILTLPPPPIAYAAGRFVGGHWQVEFIGRSGWAYSIERTTDLHTWAPVTSPTAGTGGTMMLEDTAPPAGNAFYRVKAERP